MRYLGNDILRDLKRKIVLLSGPRQSGKTTFAKSLNPRGCYLNWDVRADQRVIRVMGWPKDVPLLVLDELHKLNKWKNYVKSLADGIQKPPTLITGSARLETFRRQGDALTGRTFHYRMHPIDVSESKVFLPQQTTEERVQRLLSAGGFPEAYLFPENAERLRNDRFDLVVREDLLDLSRVSALRNIELLLELLRERVGGSISYVHLAQDLSVSPPTVKSWIELLERLYLIFIVRPFHLKLARAIRKEPKIYFYDCAAGYETIAGARLENLVACSLLKYCQWSNDRTGSRLQLYYYRDRDHREVDFIVAERSKVKWCLEVKAGDDNLSPSLRYLHEALRPEASLQLVFNLNQVQERNGINIVNAGEWLEALSGGPIR